MHNLTVNMDHDFGGYTDKLIIIELLTEIGWNQHEINTALPKILSDLDPAHSATFDSAALTVFPGVESMLQTLKRFDEVKIGLLTGNTARVAQRKLESAGIWKYFDFGCFGDDTHDKRADLVTRAFEKTGLSPSETNAYIIGDTARDIQAAHTAGIKGIGILHNSHRSPELIAAGADGILQDFLETDVVLGMLGIKA